MNSKIEELIKKLLNCESIEDFVPHSRSEAYLKAAILRSGTENLPYPASRLDVLLYDLTDKISDSLYGYKTQEKTVTPAQIEQEIVPDEGYVLSKVKINNESLKGLIERNITDLEIPNGVTIIGSHTFSGSKLLLTVTIPDSVTSIGENAFDSCIGLTSVVIGDGVTSIGRNAFYNCKALTNVSIGNGVTDIGSAAFGLCNNIKYNEYDNALYNGNDSNPCILLVKAKNTSITSCTINENTKILYGEAFYNCNALKRIIIPNNVNKIGGTAFRNCSALTSVTIGNGVTIIGDYAFTNCNSLTSITIPDNVTSIGHYAFQYCSKLYDIKIGSGVKSMQSRIFSNCSALRSITIPDNVTHIGSGMFSACDKLINITMPTYYMSDTRDISYMFSSCSSLVTAPQIDMRDITTAGNMFNNCSKLTNLSLKNIKVNLQIGSGTKYGHLLTLDSLLGVIRELIDTGSSKTLTVGTANLEKLANVYVKTITITDEMRAADEFIDSKLPFEVCESTDEGATLISDYVLTKNWNLA